MNWATIENAVAAWVKSATGLTTAGQVIWTGQNAPRTAVPRVELTWRAVGKRGRDWLAREHNPLVFAPFVFTAVAGTDVCTKVAHGLLTGDGPLDVDNVGGAPPGGLSESTPVYAIRLTDDTFKLARTLFQANAGNAIDITDAGTGTNSIVASADTVRVGAEIINRARGPRRARLELQSFAAAGVGDSSAMSYLEDVVAALELPSVRDAMVAAKVGIGVVGEPQDIGGELTPGRFEPRAVLECTLNLVSEISELGRRVDFIEVEDETESETFYVPEDPSL